MRKVEPAGHPARYELHAHDNHHHLACRSCGKIVDVPCAMLQVDMGLGKTVMTLSALRRLFDSFTLTRVLVIAPLLVAEETWPTEIETWEHTRVLTYEVITGDQTRRESRVTKAADIHIVNRENLTWLIDFWGDKWPYDAVVIDEISGFKNPSRKTKPTKKYRGRK